jgi:hypothetical protein
MRKKIKRKKIILMIFKRKMVTKIAMVRLHLEIKTILVTKKHSEHITKL